MSIKDVLSRDTRFKYMLLNRLESDFDGAGRYWAGSAKEQIKYMVAIWKNLRIKPEWLTFRELNTLSIKYTGKELILKEFEHDARREHSIL